MTNFAANKKVYVEILRFTFGALCSTDGCVR